MLAESDGAAAVRLARSALVASIERPERRDAAAEFRTVPLPAVFDEPRGVFVTLRRHPSGDLRGCIGFPSAVFPLRVAIPRAARSAALDDPRFRSVRAMELEALRVEVSVLTVPEAIDATPRRALIGQVTVGRDGLIVDRSGASGLLLPQVPKEFGWDAAEFLAATCEKAGLPPEAWLSPATTVRRFEAEVFGEESPGGAVRRVALD
ncbi:MAG: TIGR00296 family protein [Thermoplasmata archaeon]|nr:TIGR00296 family protein [Thermoplasmata archaeon]MCI4356176.1 TIGR00296 family protein [Thermoplasmata archaeon]